MLFVHLKWSNSPSRRESLIACPILFSKVSVRFLKALELYWAQDFYKQPHLGILYTVQTKKYHPSCDSFIHLNNKKITEISRCPGLVLIVGIIKVHMICRHCWHVKAEREHVKANSCNRVSQSQRYNSMWDKNECTNLSSLILPWIVRKGL